MKKLTFMIVALVLISLLGCSKDVSDSLNSSESKINLVVDFPASNNTALYKADEIDAVRLTVSSSDFSDIVKELTISGGQASGNVSVPKGSNRTFTIDGLIGSSVVISGQTTKSLNSDNETVNVTAAWLSSSVTLNVDVPSENINNVSAIFTGDGLSSARVENLNINAAVASKTFSLPRGAKNATARASVLVGQLRFDLFKRTTLIQILQPNVELSLPLSINEETEEDLQRHDGSFESTFPLFINQMGDLAVVAFDVSGYVPIYIKQIHFDLNWYGNDGDYRIVILDGFDLSSDVRFRSAPLPPAGSDGIVHWNLNWNPVEEGAFDGIILAGLEYAGSSGYPEIGYDTTAPSELSYFFNTAASPPGWFFMSDGDFAITLTAQTPEGQQLTLGALAPPANSKMKSLENIK